MSASRDQLILAWRTAQAELKSAIEKEHALRLLVVETCFPTQAHDNSAEGTQNLELGAGYKLKAVFKQNYNLADYDKVSDVMSRIRRLNTARALDAYRNLVSYRPELKVGVYKKLPDDLRKMVDEVLTVKPGLPSVELIEPATEGS